MFLYDILSSFSKFESKSLILSDKTKLKMRLYVTDA